MFDRFDRHTTTSPEDALDRWLDAMNAPGQSTPPPPAGIEGIASIARRYQSALGAKPATTVARSTIPERNGHMSHALPLPTSPNGTAWRTVNSARKRQPNRAAGWLSWLSTSLSTAVVIGLILALGGTMIYQQNGMPGGSEDPASAPGFAASPEATPAAGSLSCGAPGYRAVIDGDFAPGDLASAGFDNLPIVITDDTISVPSPDGGNRTLPPNSVLIPDSGAALSAHDDHSTTLTRLADGKTWTFPALEPRSEGLTGFRYTSRYFIGPNNQEWTDWLIVDVVTGETTTTTDIFGHPFEEQLTAWDLQESDTGDFLMVEFVQTVMGNETPEPSVTSPGLLVIPGDLDTAYFREFDSNAATLVAHVSPDGKWLAKDYALFDAATGEKVANLADDVDGSVDVIGFVNDAPTILMKTLDTIHVIQPLTNQGYVLLQADDVIRTGAYSPTSHTLILNTEQRGSPESWTLVYITTGETQAVPELNGYALLGSRSFDPIQLVETSASFVRVGDSGDAYTLRTVEMATGEVSATFENVENSSITELRREPSWSSSDATVARDTSGSVIVIGPSSGSPVALPPPPGSDDLPDGASFRFSVSPNGACISATAVKDGDTLGNSFIAPIEPDATWTELDVVLTGWFRMANEPEPETVPAQEIASPVATPSAGPTLSCASPGYRPIISGDIEAGDLAKIGANTNPIILNGKTTITAANGTRITLDADDVWFRHWSSNVILSGEDDEHLDTVTSLATGESWTFPDLGADKSQPPRPTHLQVGDWLFGPTGETPETWSIINTATGEERLISDILVEPFEQIPFLVIPPAIDPYQTPMIIGFADTQGEPPSTIVLPSSDLDDAYELASNSAVASTTAVINADGSRIAYLDYDASGSATVHVLDGFTGESIAEYPSPKTGGFYQTVGLTSDSNSLIVQDNQQLWTADLTTGIFTSISVPGGDIQAFEFDKTTGTIIASAGDGRDASAYWIDPTSGTVKPLDIPASMQVPHPAFGWALLQTRDPGQIGVGYALLDMTTGDIATTTQIASGDNGVNVIIIGGGNDPAGIYAVRTEPDSMLVLDGPGGQSFELPAPNGVRLQTSSVAIGFSPNGACLFYTDVALPGEEGGASWIAPLAPDAEWTKLPFELSGWWAPVEPAPVATPVPDVASPVVTPGT